MADIKKELNDIKNAVYGKEVRGSIHDGIKKINEESEESKAKAEEAHDVMESIMQDGFDNAALEANFEQKLDDKIANLQPEWTGFKEDITTQLADIVINVKNFGAKGDGINDDAPAIRSAYEHLANLGGGRLFFPKTEGHYLIKSTVDVDGLDVGLNHNTNSITFWSTSENVQIVADVEMHSLVYASVKTNYTQFENVFLNANNLADYCFTTNENIYTPYLSVVNSRFYNAKKSSFMVRTYVSTFSKSIFANSGRGLSISGVGGNIATSVTLNSCYALNNVEYGFNLNNLMYSALNACAVDNMATGIAYNVSGRGIALNGCGAEQVYQVFKSSSFRGITINGFYVVGGGSDDENNPTDYLFEFVAGTNATLSSIFTTGDKYFAYKLGLTGNSYGFENITVTDFSFRREDVFYQSNYKFQRPIKLLRDDETTKNETITLDVDQLHPYLLRIQHKKINHVLTIQLNDGEQGNISTANLIKGLRGSGKIVIKGNPENRSAVKLVGTTNRFFIEDNNCLVVIKDLTITNKTPSGRSFFVSVDNSKVIFDNVFFDARQANASTAVKAINSSIVNLSNGTSAGNGSFQVSSGTLIYDYDNTSKFVLDRQNQPPSGNWSKGLVVYNSNPIPGSYIGWVCKGYQDLWMGFGKIE